MKHLAILTLVTISLVSCGDRYCQVMYNDGKVEWVDNEVYIPLTKGDTVVIQHYISLKSTISSDKVYGFYKGIVPERMELANECAWTYETAVIIHK